MQDKKGKLTLDMMDILDELVVLAHQFLVVVQADRRVRLLVHLREVDVFLPRITQLFLRFRVGP